MQSKNRHISIFLSNPCEISDNILTTPSSWYLFVSKLGESSDCIEIIAPNLDHISTNFNINLSSKVIFRKTDHFSYRSFKQFYVKFIASTYRVLLKYYEIISRSNLIILRIPTPGFTILAGMAVMMRKPVVVFISGNIIKQSDSFNNSGGIIRAILWCILRLRVFLHSRILKKSKYVFSVSSELVHMYGLSLKANAILARTPVISKKEIIKLPQLKKLGRTFKIIRVCWLQESKGLENLIYSIKKISEQYNVSLDIFGSAKDVLYAEKIQNLILELGLSDIVILNGWVANDRLKQKYRDYDLHVVSSLAEGMPRVCLETAAKGVPQLITPVGGVKDFFTHMHDAYICRNCSIEALTEGFLWFLNETNLRSNLAENALKNAKKSSIEAFSERFNNIALNSNNLN